MLFLRDCLCMPTFTDNDRANVVVATSSGQSMVIAPFSQVAKRTVINLHLVTLPDFIE